MSSIEIHIISNRPSLNEFINLWADVDIPQNCNTYIKVLTTNYSEKDFSLNNGIKVEYIKQKTFPKTSTMNQAWARNELLCNADTDSDYILFFDDWQRPHKNILMEHFNYLQQGYTICGRRLECDKDGNNCKEDIRYKKDYVEDCHYGWFWTCNASTLLNKIIEINGFDNRFGGGTGGEDYEFGMRLVRSGTKMIYNPNAITYHHSHDHLELEDESCKENPVCNRSHILSPYKYLPEYGHLGDWNLMISNDFEFWWEDSIKYYKCKRCGIIGILDSQQIHYLNRDSGVIRVTNGMEQVRERLNNIKVIN